MLSTKAHSTVAHVQVKTYIVIKVVHYLLAQSRVDPAVLTDFDGDNLSTLHVLLLQNFGNISVHWLRQLNYRRHLCWLYKKVSQSILTYVHYQQWVCTPIPCAACWHCQSVWGVNSTNCSIESSWCCFVSSYSKTSLIRAAWDQGVSVTKKMPVNEKHVCHVHT